MATFVNNTIFIINSLVNETLNSESAQITKLGAHNACSSYHRKINK
jgi:hypothetical protein